MSGRERRRGGRGPGPGGRPVGPVRRARAGLDPVGEAAGKGLRALLFAGLLLPLSPLLPGVPLPGAGSALAQEEEPEAEATEAGAEAAADTTPGRQGLRVFVDCDGRFCDFDFFRREVPFVNYVRDRQDADVHVLITSQRTGAGGRNITLDFLGRGEFQGLEDRLQVSTRPQQPEEEVLEQLSRTLGLGLARYVARTPQAERVRLLLEEGAAGPGEGVAVPEEDPWDFWVFRARLRGGIEVEERQDELSVFGSLSANRVTEGLKIELSVDGNYEEENFEVDSATTVTSIQRNYGFEGLSVWSLGPHWSVGGQGSVEHSSFRNREVSVRIAPALEYNLFPYAESERQALTFLYTVGFNRFDWIEETVFGETGEVRVDQSLRVSLAMQQPWGEAGGEVEARHYFQDFGQNRVDARAFANLRLFRGLSLDIRGQVSRIRDQINLPIGDATEEEVLLEIRELQTGFEYELSFGFSYTFGSIYNNIVNPRFDAGAGRGRFF